MVQELNPAGKNGVAMFSPTGVGIVTPITQTTCGDWTELGTTLPATNVTGVVQNTSAIYANTNTRGNVAGGFSSQKPVLRDGEVTFEVLWRTSSGAAGDTSFEQLLVDRADDLAEISLGFYDYSPVLADIVSGDTVQGLAGSFYVSVEFNADIEDVMRLSVTLTVGSGAVWHKVVKP